MSTITSNDIVRPSLHRSDLNLEFVGMLAHELRNGLNSIRLLCLVAGQGPQGSPPRAWDAVDEVVDRMTPLIQDMLEFCRLSHGSFNLKFQQIDLREIGRRAANVGRLALCKKRGITFELDMPDDPVWTLGDLDRLTMACENLLDNAMRHTPAGGNVRLIIGQADCGAIISVSDSGAGIDSSFLGTLFEPFKRGRSLPSERQGEVCDHGMGLGLLFVRKIVEMHGGRVSAQSEGAGRGSEFIIALPRLVS